MESKNERVWCADHIRVTIFLQDVCALPAGALLAIFGVAAESRVESIAEGSLSEVAAKDAASYEVKQTFNRIDFILRAAETGVTLKLLDDLNNKVDHFIESVGKWVESQDFHVKRVAFGLGGLCETQSNDESYQILGDQIRILKIDPTRHKELILQVNIPAKSNVLPDAKINRVSNWAAITLEIMIDPLMPPNSVNKRYFCRCTLDFSSDEKRTESFSNEVVSNLLDELASNAMKTLKLGIE